MSKTTFFIILLVAAAIVVASIVIWLIFRPSEAGIISQEGTTSDFPQGANGFSLPSSFSETALTSEQREKLRLVAAGEIWGFWPVATNTIQYLKKDSGLWEADYFNPQIQEKDIDLGVNFQNVIGISRSALNKVLIKHSSDGKNAGYTVLDIQSWELKNLDQNIKSAVWSPDGKEIAFYYSDSPLYYEGDISESQYFGKMKADLSGAKKLADLKIADDINLSWPEGNKIYFFQKSSGYVWQETLSFDLKKGIFEKFVSGNGLSFKWNQEGSYGLFFFVQNGGGAPALKLINKDAVSLGAFPEITLPEKCVFSQKDPLLYCAIAGDLPVSAIWPDDYYQNSFNLHEAIYKINLQTFEAQPIIEQSAFEISNMDISSDETHLIFYDKKSQGLYVLNIE